MLLYSSEAQICQAIAEAQQFKQLKMKFP